jgi:hypothetical protein
LEPEPTVSDRSIDPSDESKLNDPPSELEHGPELGNVVETALAAALEAAAAAGQWTLVGQLATELAERRTRRETSGPGTVVALRAKRGPPSGAA